jgi:hypothetical protein
VPCHDAKYRRHWEELQQGTWHEQNTELHERHREDLLQALAYANLESTADVVCCLVYPARRELGNPSQSVAGCSTKSSYRTADGGFASG